MLRYLSFGATDYRSNIVGVGRRVHWEFVAVARGAVAPVLGDGVRPFRRRTLWVFPPSTAHGWISEGSCVRACFHFGFVPAPLESWALAKGFHEAPLSSAGARRILALARDLAPHHARPTGVSLLHFHRALIELSLLALDNVPAAVLPRPEDAAVLRVEAALAWYAEHLAEAPTTAAVARQAHVSVSHLRRLFWQVRRANPHRVLREIRMQRAMEQMTLTTDKLAAIAARCGFGSAADFSRAFRARHDTGPAAWRRGQLLPALNPRTA